MLIVCLKRQHLKKNMTWSALRMVDSWKMYVRDITTIVCSSFLREENHLHHIRGVGWVLGWLIKPIFALKVLGQWGQGSAVESWVLGALLARDFLVARLLFADSRRRESYAAAPLLITPRQAARFWAVVSHKLWSMPKSFREAFRVSLKSYVILSSFLHHILQRGNNLLQWGFF